jgi:hypothetical protein
VRGVAGAGATTSAGVEHPSARSKVESAIEAEPEIDADMTLGDGIEVAANHVHVSKARPIIVCQGAPLENTAGAGGVG